MDNATIGQLITFATVIAGFGWQYIREGRQHRWEVEERLEIAKVLATHTTSTAANVADALSVRSSKTAAALQASIDKNTKMTEAGFVEVGGKADAAYHEANTVNLKLQQLGLEHNALQEVGLAYAKDAVEGKL